MWDGNTTICDICGKENGGVQVRVGNVIVAELCITHANKTMEEIRKGLKTQPGPRPEKPEREKAE